MYKAKKVTSNNEEICSDPRTGFFLVRRDYKIIGSCYQLCKLWSDGFNCTIRTIRIFISYDSAITAYGILTASSC